MGEPKDHAARRGALEELLRRIPGFRGYLEKEYRRDSDRLQREHLAKQLERSKQELDRMAQPLVEAGQLDLLPRLERVRGRIDRLIGQIRGAVGGYSGVFDLVQIDEGTLEAVYDHDMALSDDVGRLAAEIKRFEAEPLTMSERLAAIEAVLDRLSESWNGRDAILSGINGPRGA